MPGRILGTEFSHLPLVKSCAPGVGVLIVQVEKTLDPLLGSIFPFAKTPRTGLGISAIDVGFHHFCQLFRLRDGR